MSTATALLDVEATNATPVLVEDAADIRSEEDRCSAPKLEQVLSENGHFSLVAMSKIQIYTERDGKVVIEGEVNSFFMKQVAQELLMQGGHCRHGIENNLIVPK